MTRQQRLFLRGHARTMELALLILIGMVVAIWFYFFTKPANDAYNKHVCAVYGYEADCKTPLPIERRLK